jgi:hypothetical protein
MQLLRTQFYCLPKLHTFKLQYRPSAMNSLDKMQVLAYAYFSFFNYESRCVVL